VVTGPDALIVAAFLLLSVRLLSVLPSSFNVDTWLELTSGRLIWHAGIPHHDSLTVISAGRAWIDQQWLAQLASYCLYRIGGLGLIGVANVGLLMSGLGIAVMSARKLGASVRAVLLPIVVCGWLFLPSTEVRTQAFAIPLFAVTVYLLASDGRRPSWRVYWALPLLVVWANLHGSVTLGAGLVALRGVTLAWESRHRLPRSPRLAARALGLILGAPLCLLLTPYGIHAVAYYHATLANSAFRHTVTEWQPVTSSLLVAGPFFALAAVVLWSFGRFPERSTLWDRVALLVLAAMTIGVIRNVAFFALGALTLLPVSLSGMRAAAPEVSTALQRRVNVGMVAVASALAVIAVGAVLTRPSGRLEAPYPKPGLLAAVETAARADQRLRIAADTRYADWLLWRSPWLAGRVASDARFELYTAHEMYQLQDLLAASGADWKRAADGDGLLVLNRSADRDAITEFLREPGARALYTDGQAIVIRRSVRAEP
jgi:hypothetical protein